MFREIITIQEYSSYLMSAPWIHALIDGNLVRRHIGPNIFFN